MGTTAAADRIVVLTAVQNCGAGRPKIAALGLGKGPLNDNLAGGDWWRCLATATPCLGFF